MGQSRGKHAPRRAESPYRKGCLSCPFACRRPATLAIRPVPHQKEVGGSAPAPIAGTVRPALPDNGPVVGRASTVTGITSPTFVVGTVGAVIATAAVRAIAAAAAAVPAATANVTATTTATTVTANTDPDASSPFAAVLPRDRAVGKAAPGVPAASAPAQAAGMSHATDSPCDCATPGVAQGAARRPRALVVLRQARLPRRLRPALIPLNKPRRGQARRVSSARVLGPLPIVGPKCVPVTDR